jgi:hypothetical protein
LSNATAYVIYDDGSTERQSYIPVEDGESLPLSKPGRYVSETEYDTFLAEINAANDARHDVLLNLEDSTLRGDYDALITLGLPDDSARRMSGYTGP